MVMFMNSTKAADYKCPSCKAPLLFDPKLGKWKCNYCESVFSLEELENKNVKVEVNDDNVNYDHYICKNCGAEIIAEENTAATFCLYCGNTAIIKERLSGDFKPSKVIPFKKVKKDAVAAFKELKKGRPFLPKAFISEKNIEKITGLYVPFWLFNISCNGDVDATGNKVKTWVVGNTHYTKTDNYRLERNVEASYTLIPIDGSIKFDDAIMNTIEPFDYKELVDFNSAYLSGFLAEKYDFKSEDAYKIAEDRALKSTLDVAKDSMNGFSSVVVTNNSLKALENGVEYALLPVYMVNIKYKDKFYLFAMNGQTGEFIGDMPVDSKKVFFSSVIMFIIVAAIVILISYLIGGNI